LVLQKILKVKFPKNKSRKIIKYQNYFLLALLQGSKIVTSRLLRELGRVTVKKVIGEENGAWRLSLFKIVSRPIELFTDHILYGPSKKLLGQFVVCLSENSKNENAVETKQNHCVQGGFAHVSSSMSLFLLVSIYSN
jgi:hypothetical protein